jgi:hypothetical protein
MLITDRIGIIGAVLTVASGLYIALKMNRQRLNPR